MKNVSGVIAFLKDSIFGQIWQDHWETTAWVVCEHVETATASQWGNFDRQQLDSAWQHIMFNNTVITYGANQFSVWQKLKQHAETVCPGSSLKVMRTCKVQICTWFTIKNEGLHEAAQILYEVVA
jgi:hypothetical protein